MEFVIFPLVIAADGQVPVSADPVRSVQSLLEAMTATPEGGWRGGEQFGLRTYFEQHRERRGALPTFAKKINEALLSLGVDWVTVTEVWAEETFGDGRVPYSIKLSYAGGRVETHRLEL